MTHRPTLVIIGASLAGAKAAEGARGAGYDGRIVLVGAEAIPPYERPPLSKGVLRGEDDVESTRVHPDGFYAEHDIELVTGHVGWVDSVGRHVHLASGDTLAYDTAVVATGATPRRIDVPGADLDGVHYLRTVDDAVRLRDAIRTSTRVAVIGGGWIGSEVAASARQAGANVLLVDPGPVPLHRVLGDEIGDVYRRVHADHGVDLHMGTGLVGLRGKGSVEEVVLSDGFEEPADVVVVGVGVVPNTDPVARTPGVRVNNGIVVDRYLQTGAPGIYAAGDVANAWHPHYGQHVRLEHWANALNQGTAAGRNAAGARESYERLPYFYSDQYDLGMEYVGRSQPGDAVVVRGDLEARKFLAFWHRDGNVTAAMHVNVWDVVEDLKAIVASPAAVDLTRLGDPDVPLAALGALPPRC